MSRRFLLALCSTVALAQVQVRPSDPFQLNNQLYMDARNSGDFDQAAARRESARALLAQTPIDSPNWLGRVHTVVQMYQGSHRRLQARAVIQDELSRAAALGDSHPVRIQLLNMLADSFQQDGNLLKALSYKEKAVAAQEAAPPSPPAGIAPAVVIRAGDVGSFQASGRMIVGSGNRFGYFYSGSSNTHMYQQLAELYRQLGRPEAAAKTMAKMRSLAKDDPMALASSYEQEGDLDQAIALYRKQAEQGPSSPQANPWESVRPLQSLANLYQRQQRWDEASAAFEQAAARLEASGTPEVRGQAAGMRLNLANMLQQAGKNREAEQVFQALLPENAKGRNGMQIPVLQGYANHLSRTDRASQAEDLVKSYLTNHAGLQPWEEAGLFMTLSQIAHSSGRLELAQEYRRTAMEKQKARQPQQNSPEGPLIGPDLQRAQEALGRGNLDEAFNLALRAVASAWLARDGEQIAWQAPALAIQLANNKAPDKGETLFRQLMPVLQARAVDNAGPLLQALQQYPRFLMVRKDRWAEVPAAIDRYRENILPLQGADGSEMEHVFQLRIEFARRPGESEAAVQPAEELLAWEESRSGNKSALYMRAAQTAAGVYESNGNLERALALYREIVSIADSAFRANEPQRVSVRMLAAMAYAQARRFDEAERLAAEVQTLGERTGNNRMVGSFASQLDQIRMMKRAAESAPVGTKQSPAGTPGVGMRVVMGVGAPPQAPPPAKGAGQQ